MNDDQLDRLFQTWRQDGDLSALIDAKRGGDT